MRRVLIIGTDVWGQSVGTVSEGYLVMFDTRRWDLQAIPKRRWPTANLRRLTHQKSEDLDNIAVEAW